MTTHMDELVKACEELDRCLATALHASERALRVLYAMRREMETTAEHPA